MSAPAQPPAEPDNTTEIEISGPLGFKIDVRRVTFEGLAIFGAIVGAGCALGHFLPGLEGTLGPMLGLFAGGAAAAGHIAKTFRG